jgi:hypothetical protein
MAIKYATNLWSHQFRLSHPLTDTVHTLFMDVESKLRNIGDYWNSGATGTYQPSGLLSKGSHKKQNQCDG